MFGTEKDKDVWPSDPDFWDEYRKRIKRMNEVCNPNDPDVIQINEWARENFKKYGQLFL